MQRNKLAKALLFPHVAVMLLLLPVATAFLVYSMVNIGSQSPITIISYVLSAYTLTVWCVRIPYLIRWFKTFKVENKYARRWLDDDRLRMNVSLYGSMFCNCAYAVFQLWLGVYHGSFWFYSMAGYYNALFSGSLYTASQGRGKYTCRVETLPRLWLGLSCHEFGTIADGLFYGVLGPNLPSS